jgi:hypothetical protein
VFAAPNLSTGSRVVINHTDAATGFRRATGSGKSGGSGSNYQHIEFPAINHA